MVRLPEELFPTRKGVGMNQTIAPVRCECGTVNYLGPCNTRIAHFRLHPQYDFLRSWCEGCGRMIRIWSPGDLAVAMAEHWEVLTAVSPDPEVVESYNRLHPPRWRLTPRHEHDIAGFTAALERLTPAEAAELMEGGNAYRGCYLPGTWPCTCGSRHCEPETPAGAPLETT